MRFNFQCTALCTIKGDDADPAAKIVGFYASRNEAESGAAEREHEQRRMHQASSASHGASLCYRYYLDYEPARYVFVPLSGMTFRTLTEAQEMIETAAVLQWKGCGAVAGEAGR